jgi:hypothetical protein
MQSLPLPHIALNYMVLEHVGDVMAIGWLLDVTVEQNAATLWIKLKQGGILRIVDKYQLRK